MTEISTRQFILIALFLLVTSKLMSMPTVVYEVANNDAIWAIMIDFLIELGIIFLICQVIKKNQSQNLYTLLSQKFGVVLAYIILIILYVFIGMKLIYALQEIFTFFNEFLYEQLNPIVFYLTTFFVIGYLAFKGARTIGRTLEIIYIFIALGLLITVISNLEFLKFDTMLPYLNNGISPIINGVSRSMFYFGNSICLLFFVGKVQIVDKFSLKVLLSCSLFALFIVAFCFIFYDIYGYATQFTLFALTDYSQFDPYILELQRLNWLSTIIDITKLFCSCAILLYCLGQCGKNIAKTKSTFYPIGISCGLVFLRSFILSFDLDILKNFVVNFVSFATIVVIVLIAIICIILQFNRRKNEKTIVK